MYVDYAGKFVCRVDASGLVFLVYTQVNILFVGVWMNVIVLGKSRNWMKIVLA